MFFKIFVVSLTLSMVAAFPFTQELAEQSTQAPEFVPYSATELNTTKDATIGKAFSQVIQQIVSANTEIADLGSLKAANCQQNKLNLTERLCFASIGKIELLSDSGEVKPMALLFEFALLSNGSKVQMQLKGIKGKVAEPEGAPVLYGWHWWRRIEKEFHRSYTKLEHAVHKVMEHVNINCSVSLDKGGSSNCNVQPH